VAETRRECIECGEPVKYGAETPAGWTCSRCLVAAALVRVFGPNPSRTGRAVRVVAAGVHTEVDGE